MSRPTMSRQTMSRQKKMKILLLRCVVLLGCLPASAILAPMAAGGDGRGAAARVQSVEGRTYVGDLAMRSQDRLTVTGNVSGALHIDEVIRIDYRSRRPGGLGGRNVILLANGDRLVAKPLSSDEEMLRVQLSQFPQIEPFEIPLEVVRGIAWRLPHDRASRLRTLTALMDHAAKADKVLLRNGNSASGEFLSLTSGKILIETATGQRKIENSSIRSLACNPDLIDFPQPAGIRVLVTLDEGSRFTVRDFRINTDGEFECVAVFGAKFSLPMSHIVSLQILGGRAVYLSDLQPAQYTFSPYLSLKWPLRADRNVAGGPLRLLGLEYAKGLGTHSQCAVSYALDNRFRRFQAIVGIDEGTGDKGHAVVRVLLDGKPVFTSGPLWGEGRPVVVTPIDVSGAKRLTLVVEFGDLGDVQDHVNWCDALLVKKR